MPCRRRIALVLALAGTAGAAAADPKADYLLHCGGCHRPDASGAPPAVPSLVGTLGRIAGTAEGRDYLVRVPGAAHTPLTDDALAAVVNWVLLEFNADTLPADFEPLTGPEVGRSRSNVLADPLAVRRALWPEY